MIGFVHGTVTDTGVVLTSGGVGYLVHTADPLPVGEQVSLHVTTIVREDAITLFGFAQVRSQELFAALTAVPGIGPSVALSLLRDVGPAAVVTAILGSDLKALAKAKGVSTKTADKLVTLIKLSPDLVELATGAPAVAAAASSTEDPAVLEIVSALENLGYSTEQALDAARAAVARTDDDAARLHIALATLTGRAA